MVDPEKRVDGLVEELKERVDERRRRGEYPEGIEEDLESRFALLQRAASSRRNFDPLETALHHQRTAGHFARDRIVVDSTVPGGSAIHRAAGVAVRRQVDGLLDQMQQFSDAVNETSELLGSMLGDPPFHHHDDLRADLDMMSDRITRLERARSEIGVLGQRVNDLQRDVRALAATPPDLDWERFSRRFRGDTDELLERYGLVADRFVGLSPVVDIGCGGGDLLSLLAERGVDAWGVEVDPALAKTSAALGHQVRVGDGVEILGNLGDESVGGIALIQVIEHLAPSSVPELIVEAARVLRPGGVLYIESPNPTSIYVHTHSLWLDPSHTRPIHPLYLDFVCQSAHFASVETLYTSPVPADQVLTAPDDDGSGLAASLTAVVDRLNAVLFGPQDYAIVATR